MTDNVQNQFSVLCDNLRALRVAQNLSIEQLAVAARVPLKVLQQVEDRIFSKSFTTTHLFRLCEFFHIRPADLFVEVKQTNQTLQNRTKL